MSGSRKVRSQEFIDHVHKAVTFFCKKNKHIPFEDLFHEVYLKFLEGSRDHSVVWQVCIDVYREIIADKRQVHSQEKYNLATASGLDSVPRSKRGSDTWKSQIENKIAIEQVLEQCDDLEGILVFQMMSEGLWKDEIATQLGCSGQWVTCIIRRTISKLKEQGIAVF